MKKIVIIGGTSGIGKELALLYAKENCLVAISGRRNELLEEVKKEYSNNIITECFDVTGAENIIHVESMIRRLGGADILIYNSGYGAISTELDWTIDQQTTLTNVNGFVEIANYAYNYFSTQQHGQIVAISSVASIRGGSHAPAYNASKAYVSSYMEGLYIKAKKAKLPITITDIKPGFVDTDLAKGVGIFWVASPQKAALQIKDAIAAKKRITYITKRWWLIAKILKHSPIFIYRKIG